MAAGTERMHSSSKRVFGVDRASLGAILGGRLSLSYHRFRQSSGGNSSKADKSTWYPFGHIITLDDEDDEDDPEDDPDPEVEYVPPAEDGYDSYDDEEEVYPDVVGPADADADADTDTVGDNNPGENNAEDDNTGGDNLYRYTVKDIVFLPEDHDVIAAAAAAATAALTRRSGRTIKRKIHHDELYDDNRSIKRQKNGK